MAELGLPFAADTRGVLPQGYSLCNGFIGFTVADISMKLSVLTVPENLLDDMLQVAVAEFDEVYTVGKFSVNTHNVQAKVA